MAGIGKEMAEDLRERINAAKPRITQAEAAVKLLEDAGRNTAEQRDRVSKAKLELAKLEQALKNQGY